MILQKMISPRCVLGEQWPQKLWDNFKKCIVSGNQHPATRLCFYKSAMKSFHFEESGIVHSLVLKRSIWLPIYTANKKIELMAYTLHIGQLALWVDLHLEWKTKVFMEQIFMCSFWNVPLLECALLECALFGMYPFWYVPFWNGLFLECALFGMWSFWNVLYLDWMCSFWNDRSKL